MWLGLHVAGTHLSVVAYRPQNKVVALRGRVQVPAARGIDRPGRSD